MFRLCGAACITIRRTNRSYPELAFVHPLVRSEIRPRTLAQPLRTIVIVEDNRYPRRRFDDDFGSVILVLLAAWPGRWPDAWSRSSFEAAARRLAICIDSTMANTGPRRSVLVICGISLSSADDGTRNRSGGQSQGRGAF